MKGGVIKMTSLQLIKSSEGDWEILKKDNEIIYSGHSIPSFVWLGLIQTLGCNVEEVETDNIEDFE